MNWFAHLTWSHATAVSILIAFVLFAVGYRIKIRVKRRRARRRRFALNRLNRPGFKSMDHRSYRAWR